MTNQELVEKAADLGINTADSEFQEVLASGGAFGGYVSHGNAAWLASQGISECACGHSVKP
ncbi:hypothetical protein [Denitrificimonas caeni]|uniref:Uncharacterized protein n=1 Tax=Denitrificimonas caeni TaxID=521720 RepID=A0AAE9VTP8_9GAMM|nr:hypothetical protein [Denitrificimonas caeni]WBE26240.1 hypothetical protein O6P33_05260 [Denitrificimonas caeni]